MLSVVMLNDVIPSLFMLSVTKLALNADCIYAECRYAQCRYIECRFAEFRYAKFRYAECSGALSSHLLSVLLFNGYCHVNKYLTLLSWSFLRLWTFIITTFSIMKFSITTLRIMTFSKKRDTQHSVIVLLY
jgi:hypothetical protein